MRRRRGVRGRLEHRRRRPIPDRMVQMPEPYQCRPRDRRYTYIISDRVHRGHLGDRRRNPAGQPFSLMHHAVLYLRTPDSRWLRDTRWACRLCRRRGPARDRSSDGDRQRKARCRRVAGGYVPGAPPYHAARRHGVPREGGSDFVLQLHYTANGTAGADQTRIGSTCERCPRQACVRCARQRWLVYDSAGRPGSSATARSVLAADAQLLGAGPHMHLRGKAMTLQATYPDGRPRCCSTLPRYDFNWQQLYKFDDGKPAPRAHASRSWGRGTTPPPTAITPTRRPR